MREIGQGVYGLGYAHAIRYDRYDNLWVVDKGTNAVVKFDPAGYTVMNLGRRPEAFDGWEFERVSAAEATPRDGYFNGPTDIGWDADDNIYVSEGYANNRIAKFDKNGDWIKTWGQYGEGGEHADMNPGNFRNVHNMQVDREGNVYAGDRGNRRIQVFDSEGTFLRFIFLNVPYDKSRHPALGNLPMNRPDETAPWTLCITTDGPTQYLFVADQEPGRLYKMTLEGKILGLFGGIRSSDRPVQLAARHRLPLGERGARRRPEQLARAEAGHAIDLGPLTSAVSAGMTRPRVRIDYQRNANHSMFGRYLATFVKEDAAFAKSDNVLTTNNPGVDNLAQSLVIGDTRVIGGSSVNALRVAANRVAVFRTKPPVFAPADLGIPMFAYFPGNEMVVNVTGGFRMGSLAASAGVFETTAFQVGDDFTLVRGRHQLALGANVAYWTSDQLSSARSGGALDLRRRRNRSRDG